MLFETDIYKYLLMEAGIYKINVGICKHPCKQVFTNTQA